MTDEFLKAMNEKSETFTKTIKKKIRERKKHTILENVKKQKPNKTNIITLIFIKKTKNELDQGKGKLQTYYLTKMLTLFWRQNKSEVD